MDAGVGRPHMRKIRVGIRAFSPFSSPFSSASSSLWSLSSSPASSPSSSPSYSPSRRPPALPPPAAWRRLHARRRPTRGAMRSGTGCRARRTAPARARLWVSVYPAFSLPGLFLFRLGSIRCHHSISKVEMPIICIYIFSEYAKLKCNDTSLVMFVEPSTGSPPARRS